MKVVAPFIKAEAAGNDFICINRSDIALNVLTPEKIRQLCDRHCGIGADGILYLSQLEKASARMIYFNADGSRGEMCGNGLRAATLFARNLGFIQDNQKALIKADDGWHHVFFENGNAIEVEIFYADFIPLQRLRKVHIPPHSKILGFVNTGVPHLVLEVNADLTQKDVLHWGRTLRHDPTFAPQGANVNFVRTLAQNKLFVRTYERGVEAETLSCGSGVCASVLLYLQNNPRAGSTVAAHTAGGILWVTQQSGRLLLKGPARLVFKGEMEI